MNGKLKPCRHCGKRVAVNAKRCPHCGGAAPVHSWLEDFLVTFLLDGSLNCRTCGNKVYYRAAYCPRCGTPHPAAFSWLRLLLDPKLTIMLLVRIFVVLIGVVILLKALSGS